jgi:ATF/CREB family transcription factor
MSAAVAQRQSSSPVQTKRAPSAGANKPDLKSEGTSLKALSIMLTAGQNGSPPRDPNNKDMETSSTFLISDKFLAAEHNPFEQSFAIRPGSSGNGTDTPKPNLPGVLEMFTPGGTNQYDQFGFAESLRHGPLSPNMLAGPTTLPFDPSSFRTGLTPNESNIRTGLTPGNTPGFPLLPTPGTAALLGPYTPNTTAALASMQSSTYPVQGFVPPGRPNDPFNENQAASGLVFLAQTSQQQANIPAQNASTREELAKRAAMNNTKVNAYQDPSTLIKKSEESKTNTRSKKLKEDPPPSMAKESKSKKSKAQETDDDKRKNFLERNRQGTHPRHILSLFLSPYCLIVFIPPCFVAFIPPRTLHIFHYHENKYTNHARVSSRPKMPPT